VVKNVCKLQKAPKVPESEMVIVQDVPGFVALLRAVAGALVCPRHRGPVQRYALGRSPGVTGGEG